MIVESRWATIRVVRFSHTFANELWMLRSVCVSRADVACKSHVDSLSALSQQPVYIPTASILTAVFQINQFHCFFNHLFSMRILGDKWHGFLWAGRPSCHPTNSVKALNPTSSLTSSFLHLSPDYWWKTCCSLYTLWRQCQSVYLQQFPCSRCECHDAVTRKAYGLQRTSSTNHKSLLLIYAAQPTAKPETCPVKQRLQSSKWQMSRNENSCEHLPEWLEISTTDLK